MQFCRFAFRRKMLYLCSARPRTSRSYGASSVSFGPYRPKKRPGEGVTKCFVIFSAGFVVFSNCRIVFSKCFLVSRKQPAVCFRRLKTLKLKPRDVPFFRVVAHRNEGTEICPGEGPRPQGWRRGTKAPGEGPTRSGRERQGRRRHRCAPHEARSGTKSGLLR